MQTIIYKEGFTPASKLKTMLFELLENNYHEIEPYVPEMLAAIKKHYSIQEAEDVRPTQQFTRQ